MVNIPHKIIEVDFEEMETRFWTHYLKLYDCKNLIGLENKVKKTRRRFYVRKK